MEDAGFDWKILGPDVQQEEYVAHTCDQDAYAYRQVSVFVSRVSSFLVGLSGARYVLLDRC